MISENALAGLQQIFTRAAGASLAVSPGDSIVVEALAANAPAATQRQRMVVLTVASYRFRVLAFFHLGDDAASVAYYTRGDAGREVTDDFGELANLCCGAMNRELGHFFPHTGMSTPYVLSGECLPFIKAINPAHVARYRIVINDAVTLHATLCVCAYAPIDFRFVAPSAVEESGALELF